MGDSAINQGRQLGVDMLRLICATAVILFHFGFRGYSADGLQDVQFPELAGFAQYGWVGVEVFFMISGYVIYDSVRSKSLTSFLYGRFVRIFPTLWFCAIVTTLIVTGLGAERFYVSIRDILGNVVLWIPYSGYTYKMVDGVYWSLVYELQFYVLIGGESYSPGQDGFGIFSWCSSH